MVPSPLFLRVSLVVCALGMALLAVFFLRRRKLSLSEYLAWGLVTLLIPLLGPFLVIAVRPGQARGLPFRAEALLREMRERMQR